MCPYHWATVTVDNFFFPQVILASSLIYYSLHTNETQLKDRNFTARVIERKWNGYKRWKFHFNWTESKWTFYYKQPTSYMSHPYKVWPKLPALQPKLFNIMTSLMMHQIVKTTRLAPPQSPFLKIYTVTRKLYKIQIHT